VTLRTGASSVVLERMGSLGALGTELLLPALEQYRSTDGVGVRGGQGGLWGSSPREAGPPVHDVCAVAWVAAPGVFGLVPARVQVETCGQLTSGMTVTDFEAAGANARVAMDIDVDGFWELTLGAYRRVAEVMGR
jgi:purine nucleosidase